MFERLVAEFRKGGTLETGALAAKLGTSPQLVQAMLEHLQRTGLIKSYANCDNSGCQGCSLSDACGTSPVVRLWQTTSES
jgi:hypothetical protein